MTTQAERQELNDRLQAAVDAESAAEEALQVTRHRYAHGKVGAARMRAAFERMEQAKAAASEAMAAWVAVQPPSPPEPETEPQTSWQPLRLEDAYRQHRPRVRERKSGREGVAASSPYAPHGGLKLVDVEWDDGGSGAEPVGKLDVEVDHDCDDHAVPYESDGALGHGWECGRCGRFLQAG